MGDVKRMDKTIKFREYVESDRFVLEQIIRDTWCYDRFCSPDIASRLASVYLASCLANQTYTQVALVDNVPVGIIMGKDRRNHKCPFSLQMRKMKAIAKLLVKKEGRSVSKIFGNVEGIDKDLLSSCSVYYEGELAFFAVDKNCRGLGIGKALFLKLVDYMESEGIKNFYLFTDSSCNYGFYEHQGMTRRGEKGQLFDVNGLPGDMRFFLYDYNL